MAAIPTTAKNPFVFEPGDLRILVTHSGVLMVGKVSAHALAFGSQVLRNSMYPPWSQDVAVEEIDFTTDSGESLLILLRIMHLQFREVPKQLDYKELLQLAVLCDKFDCAKLVQPWLDIWFRHAQVEQYGYVKMPEGGEENWVFIAWVFGKERIFVGLVNHLVRNSIETEYGTLTNALLEPIEDPLPPGILESIQATRKAIIHKILHVPMKMLDRLADSNKVICVHGVRFCDKLAYGSIVLGLFEEGCRQPRQMNGTGLSIKTLLNRMQTVRSNHNRAFSLGKPPVDHSECLRSCFSKEQYTWSTFETSAVLPFLKEYLKSQNEKINENQ